MKNLLVKVFILKSFIVKISLKLKKDPRNTCLNFNQLPEKEQKLFDGFSYAPQNKFNE